MAESKDQSEKEVARRRDDVFRRMLNTPPKPHDQMMGKGKPKKKSTGKRKPAK